MTRRDRRVRARIVQPRNALSDAATGFSTDREHAAKQKGPPFGDPDVWYPKRDSPLSDSGFHTCRLSLTGQLTATIATSAGCLNAQFNPGWNKRKAQRDERLLLVQVLVSLHSRCSAIAAQPHRAPSSLQQIVACVREPLDSFWLHSEAALGLFRPGPVPQPDATRFPR